MKRFVSVLLAFCLTLSLVGVAFAQPGNSITLNEAKTLALRKDEEVILSFVPPSSGIYKVTVAAVEKACIEVLVYCGSPDDNGLGEGIVITTPETSYKGLYIKPLIKVLDADETEITYLNAKKGREISISIADKTSMGDEIYCQYGFEGLIDLFTPSEVKVTIENAELENMKPGDKHHCGHKDTFEFIPDRHGKYRFKSNLAEGADPQIKIYSCDGFVGGADNAETNSSDLNFDVTLTLDAGETYIVECENNAENGETFEPIGSFDVAVEEIITEKTITATVVSINKSRAILDVGVTGNPEKIRFVTPDGASMTLTPDSPKVNSVLYNDGISVWNVALPIYVDEQTYSVYAKINSQWSEYFATVTLNAPADDVSLKSFDITDDIDGVIYQGVNNLTFTTGTDVTKVQLMKDGNTWSYSDSSMYEDIDGVRVWTVKMNFTKLGNNAYDIRIRGNKTAFIAVDTLKVLVYSN